MISSVKLFFDKIWLEMLMEQYGAREEQSRTYAKFLIEMYKKEKFEHSLNGDASLMLTYLRFLDYSGTELFFSTFSPLYYGNEIDFKAMCRKGIYRYARRDVPAKINSDIHKLCLNIYEKAPDIARYT